MSKRKILIVDDDSDIRKLVMMTLQAADDQVREAGSGDEALTILNQMQPDFVLLDVVMPGGKNGLDVCRQIKRDPRFNKTRVIMLTSKGRRDDIQSGFDAGADHYLVKPFSPLALLGMVDNVY